MDQNEYARLTNYCDSLLHQFSSDEAVMAIPWLYVLNGHPNSLYQYRYAFRKRSFVSATVFTLKSLVYSGYKLLNSFSASQVKHRDPLEHTDVLFVSHLINAGMKNSHTDFYYGELPYHVQTEKGLKTMIGLLDHTPGTKTKKQRAAIEEGEPLRCLFPKTLSFTKELKLIGKGFSARKKLGQEKRKETDPVKKQMLREAALHAVSPETITALRIYETVKSLIQQHNPSTLVVTWEGRSWERMAVHAARNAGMHCIGYQHSILLASSHSVKQSLGKSFDPDIIFTVGEITAGILKHAGKLTDTDIIPYGSYRLVQTPAIVSAPILHKKEQSACLVAPEGIEPECVLLFEFAIQLAQKMPGTDFIFRTHPVLPFPVLAKKYKQFAKLPANCIISDLPAITDDFRRCSFLLYRGSSVAMYAVINGLKPFYYALPGELSIDPLYVLGDWRMIVQNTDDFIQATAADKNQPADEKQQQYMVAAKFCNDYVIPSNEKLFLNSLTATH